MATYTVIQDIEAEDKFLGPLTLKQFIFGAAGCFFGYLSFFAISQNAAFLLIIFAPPGLLGFFLAIPWNSQQPTEVWVLAKLRFYLKPKARIWNQSGIQELVTVTAPKVVEKHLTDGLSENQVESRLKALAETIDSRGWVTKNATILEGYGATIPTNQRLIGMEAMPKDVPEIDINQYHDVLADDSRLTGDFQQMIDTSTQTRRQQTLEAMDRVRSAQEQPHDQPQYIPSSLSADEEKRISQQLQERRSQNYAANSNMRTLPTDYRSKPIKNQPIPEPQAEMTKPVDPDIIELAQNNDLDVATIARQAHKHDASDGEVVVSLR